MGKRTNLHTLAKTHQDTQLADAEVLRVGKVDILVVPVANCVFFELGLKMTEFWASGIPSIMNNEYCMLLLIAAPKTHRQSQNTNNQNITYSKLHSNMPQFKRLKASYQMPTG
jgi:hypothetical protein